MFARALSVRSSLAARTLVSSRSGLAALPSALQQKRHFHNSIYRRAEEEKKKVESTPEQEKNVQKFIVDFAEAQKEKEKLANPPEEPNVSDIIEQYGKVTFFGALAAVLVTKEVLILDPELLLAMETLCVATCAYVMTGNQLREDIADEEEEQNTHFTDSVDFMKSMIGQYKQIVEVGQVKPEVLTEYLGEYKAAIQEHAAYQTVLPQHEAQKKRCWTLLELSRLRKRMRPWKHGTLK